MPPYFEDIFHGDCSIVRLDQRTETRRGGELSRMVAGRIRFFSAGVRAEGYCHGIPDRYFERHHRHPVDAGDAPDRRFHLRPRRRPLGPPADPDGRHPLVSVSYTHLTLPTIYSV